MLNTILTVLGVILFILFLILLIKAIKNIGIINERARYHGNLFIALFEVLFKK